MLHAAETTESRREQLEWDSRPRLTERAVNSCLPGTRVPDSGLNLPAGRGAGTRGGQQRAVFAAPAPSSAPRARAAGPGENYAQHFITQEVGGRLDTELCRHHRTSRAFVRVTVSPSAKACRMESMWVCWAVRVTNPLRENKGRCKLTGSKRSALQTKSRFVC